MPGHDPAVLAVDYRGQVALETRQSELADVLETRAVGDVDQEIPDHGVTGIPSQLAGVETKQVDTDAQQQRNRIPLSVRTTRTESLPLCTSAARTLSL